MRRLPRGRCVSAMMATTMDRSMMPRPSGDGQVAVRLQPRARVDEIAGERGGMLLVRVAAPPLDGRANAALCRLIAKRARVGVTRVSIVRGAGARDKVVRVEGVSTDELRARLLAPAAG
jgi:uncharacterized protein